MGMGMGMGMGIEQWEWEGMGIPIVFPHTSTMNRDDGSYQLSHAYNRLLDATFWL